MLITQPRWSTHIAGIAVFSISGAVATLKILPLSSATLPIDFLGPALLMAVAFVFAWAEFVRRQRVIEIDVSRNQVVVQRVSWLLRKKTSIYPADSFVSVVSYVPSFSRFPQNHVELVTRNGSESLLLAMFTPSSSAKSFVSIPKEGEAPEAGSLREAVAITCGYADEGFLGYRFPLHSISP